MTTGILKQCPRCDRYLKVPNMDVFDGHLKRCAWRQRQWMLSVLALVLGLVSIALSLVK